MVLELMAAASDTEWEQMMYVDPYFVNRMAEWMMQQQNVTTGAFRRSTGLIDLKLRVNVDQNSEKSIQGAKDIVAITGQSKSKNSDITTVVKINKH